jgi:hypothetical protein
MEENTIQTNTAEAYVSELANIKANTVDRSEYERIVNENAVLANALANGVRMDAPAEEQIIDVQELRNRVVNGKYKNDMEYFRDIQSLRNELLKQGTDPWVNSKSENISTEMYDAERLDELITYALAEADGDPVRFSSAFNSKIVMPITKK